MSETTRALDYYRNHWYDLGAVLAMGIVGTTVLRRPSLNSLQTLSTLNFAAVLVHQFEEYRFPGTFPGQYNARIFGSDRPDRYPMNTLSAMLANAAITYAFYLPAVLFPESRRLGLGPVMLGLGQVFAHAVVLPVRTGKRYSPGLLSAVLLHLPIGISYLRVARKERPVTSSDVSTGLLHILALALAGIIIPEQVMKDYNSPYRFSVQQTAGYPVNDHDSAPLDGA